jgi:hypothetical protein
MLRKEIIPAVVLFFVILVFTVTASISAPETGRVAIVYPPWIGADDAVIRASRIASVAIVGSGTFGNIVIAELGDRTSRTGIYETGAWWMFDPSGLGGCFSQPSTEYENWTIS